MRQAWNTFPPTTDWTPLALLLALGAIGCGGGAAPNPQPLAADLIEAVTSSYAAYVDDGPRPAGIIVPSAWDDLPNAVGGDALREALTAHAASQPPADQPWMVDFSRTAFFAELFAEAPGSDIANNELLVEVRDPLSADCCHVFAVTMRRNGGEWRVGPVRRVGHASDESIVFYFEEDAAAAEEPATGWWVDLDVDHPQDTMGNAWSPTAPAPAMLAGAEDDFSGAIRYLCLNARERELGNVAPVMIVFQTPPRLFFENEGQASGSTPVALHAIWDGEAVALKASAVRSTLSFEQEDAAERATGESSHAEFLRRLVESGSTADDVVGIELDWMEVGPVRYTFSLEGAADAIREAGRPCGVE